jgi:transcriptional regulator with XRE-family HTH domain
MTKSEKVFKNTLALVGARLQELRLKKGFATAKSFTERYNLPEIQYWRMENGKANITLKSLSKILAIHNITFQEFFCLVVGQKLAA